ncbi:MAG: PPOX class F420-dependent oxidoreductase [Acidobacteria bacterium]|jgi:PPOX class probable F420-dependent enzyme|nr:MAG: PPOX class F420-dependent oxidoreductase [Acidobacteriota bacterium]
MPTTIPAELQGQKYISLITFRKNGMPVATPVWFAESNGKLYVFTNPRSGKVKRIRNNPAVKVAPSTMRGRVIGPEFSGKARILSPEEAAQARKLLEQKYWLMRVPFLWSKDSVFLEIELD